MKASSLDKLISARLSLAGLKPKATFHANLADAVAKRLDVGPFLSRLSDAEVYGICKSVGLGDGARTTPDGSDKKGGLQ